MWDSKVNYELLSLIDNGVNCSNDLSDIRKVPISCTIRQCTRLLNAGFIDVESIDIRNKRIYHITEKGCDMVYRYIKRSNIMDTAKNKLDEIDKIMHIYNEGSGE